MADEEEEIDDITKSLDKQGLIRKFSLKQLINFIDEFGLRPNRSRNIFPNKTVENSTAMYYQKCNSIYDKFIVFNKIVSVWSLNLEKLIQLTMEVSKSKHSDSIEKLDHYFSIELLISFAFNIHKQNKESNIEFLIGNFLGIYCKACFFSEIEIAHVIDQLTILFPSFYLPKSDFATEKDQKDYFNKMVNFFHGILCEFTASTSGKIMKKILTPIKSPISKLSEIELMYIKVVEDNFFNSLFDKLNFTSNQRGIFLMEYDAYGHFRDFLRINERLYKYGYEYENNGEVTELSVNSNISGHFKLKGYDKQHCPGFNENLQRLLI